MVDPKLMPPISTEATTGTGSAITRLVGSAIDFNDISIRLGLFYAKRLENCILWTFKLCSFVRRRY